MSERAKTFDALYRENADPWKVHTSAYERDKYAATLQALSKPRYDHILEIGCSIGVMTRALAMRRGRLLAVDVSDVALRHARALCTASHVTFRKSEVPDGWPSGSFDLIVLSEVLYFLDRDEIEACARLTAASLSVGGELLLVNWTGETTTSLSGNEAAEVFLTPLHRSGFSMLVHRSEPTYRIDLLGRPSSG